MDDPHIEHVDGAQSAPATAGVDAAAHESHAVALAAATWAVPGLGHFLLKRWTKGVVFFAAVAGLAIAGYAMRGEAFAPGSDGPFGTLGFLADVGSGIFYFLSRVIEPAGSGLARSAGDYGTRLIAAAGIVNVLAVVDAYETARRRGA